MGRSKAKKEEDMWKAVARDMKRKGTNYRKPGDMPPPPPRMAPKPPKNKRSGTDYVGR